MACSSFSQAGGLPATERNPLTTDLLVVDETSMVDVSLMHALLRAHPNQSSLIIVATLTNFRQSAQGWSCAI